MEDTEFWRYDDGTHLIERFSPYKRPYSFLIVLVLIAATLAGFITLFLYLGGALPEGSVHAAGGGTLGNSTDSTDTTDGTNHAKPQLHVVASADFLDQFLPDILTGSMKATSLQISDFSGKLSGITGINYEITNITIEDMAFSGPATQLLPKSKSDQPKIFIAMKDARAVVNFSWSYSKLVISGRGDAKIDIKNMPFSATATVARKGEQPELSLDTSSIKLGASDGDWDLTILKSDTIDSAFSRLLSGSIEDELRSKASNSITRELTTNLPVLVRNYLAHTTNAMHLWHPFSLLVDQAADPVDLSEPLALHATMKGTPTFTPPDSKIFSECSKMDARPVVPAVQPMTNPFVQVDIGGHILAVMACQAHMHGLIKFRVSPGASLTDLPLPLTTSGLGKYLPALEEQYPGRDVELEFVSAEVPGVSISESGISVQISGNMSVLVEENGASSSIYSCKADLMTSLILSTVKKSQIMLRTSPTHMELNLSSEDGNTDPGGLSAFGADLSAYLEAHSVELLKIWLGRDSWALPYLDGFLSSKVLHHDGYLTVLATA